MAIEKQSFLSAMRNEDFGRICNVPSIPKRKFSVTTITRPYEASTLPSYGFPEFHSKDSPWRKTITGKRFLSSASAKEAVL